MNTIRHTIKYFTKYHSQYFDLSLFVKILALLIILLASNYIFDVKREILNPYYGQTQYWILMLCWHSIPFLMVCIIIGYHKNDWSWCRSVQFWINMLVGFGLLALNQSLVVSRVLRVWFDGVDLYFISKCFGWLLSFFVVVIPLLLYQYLERAKSTHDGYGLYSAKGNFDSYLAILAIAALFVFIGSFFGDIQAYYPRYAYSQGEAFAHANDLPEYLALICYEMAYATDFVSVELFYRGFLIYAFCRWFGGYSVLAMVASYMVLHFGKPLPESISSIFGGYALGIISYYSRSVWGGIIIHVGVAWLMELLGYLHRVY